ncbi:hypothetical protein HYH03_009477 [Edaphochlamys debaryana]|uniref:Protein kinase domain-containing protein n=1 Tax=Edaphochlamys debaryana TaxID=47281 RepID=A0A835Y086_9CHLO|nr:hypothetical protein HYH03_009477 [Edaphochlamys debaryana]|eukprot:KAG2492233.1 hypothetical protein HYH03_009477 [Edaphochlamys debaryana]
MADSLLIGSQRANHRLDHRPASVLLAQSVNGLNLLGRADEHETPADNIITSGEWRNQRVAIRLQAQPPAARPTSDDGSGGEAPRPIDPQSPAEDALAASASPTGPGAATQQRVSLHARLFALRGPGGAPPLVAASAAAGRYKEGDTGMDLRSPMTSAAFPGTVACKCSGSSSECCTLSDAGSWDGAALGDHPDLVRVFDVRTAVVDGESWGEVCPLPVLRPCWPGPPPGGWTDGWAHRASTSGTVLRRFLEANGFATRAAAAGRDELGGLKVYPGDMLPAPPPPSPAHRALASVPGLVPGARVTVSVMEHCLLGNLCSLSRSRPSPFLAAGPAWPLPTAQAALLRTARDVASGLQALHAAGAAHGALHPANVLLAASHTEQLGFVARLADAGSATLEDMAADPWGPLSPRGQPWAASLAPEAYARPSAVHTPQADMYAYGMLLCLMAAGELPGRRARPELLRRAAALGELEAPAWPPGQHGHLAPLYAWCVDPDPSRRPTAGQAIQALLAFGERLAD